MFFVIHPIESAADQFTNILGPLAKMQGISEEELKSPEFEQFKEQYSELFSEIAPVSSEVVINTQKIKSIVNTEDGKAKIFFEEKLSYTISEDEYKILKKELLGE